MKILFTISLFLFANILYSQFDTTKYSQFGDSLFFSELKLVSNKTFQYDHHNMHSCWTWYSVIGTWKIKDTILILTDSKTWNEDDIKFDTAANDDNYVTIEVKNDKGKALKNIKVDYYFRYSSRDTTYLTDTNGKIKIMKRDLAKGKSQIQDNYVHFGIRYSNKRSSDISLSTTIDSIHNRIKITLLDNPKQAIVMRKTYYKILDDKLYFQKQLYLNNKNYLPKSWGNFERE
jgi:hypothetical protein